MPAGTTTSGITQVGAWPTSTTSATSTVAITSWSITISVRRRPVRSSQAPSSGPLTRLGSVIAATVAPASAALPVRSSTSSTTPTENISSETRASVAAETNFEVAGLRAQPPERVAVHQRAGGIACGKRKRKSGSTCFLISRRRSRFDP